MWHSLTPTITADLAVTREELVGRLQTPSSRVGGCLAALDSRLSLASLFLVMSRLIFRKLGTNLSFAK